MSSPILPIQGPTSLQPTRSSAPTAVASPVAFRSRLTASERSISTAGIPANPPAEVFEQIALAGRINEQLRERGYQLRFSEAQQGRKVSIELQDSQRNVLRSVSAAEALDIVTGKSLD